MPVWIVLFFGVDFTWIYCGREIAEDDDRVRRIVNLCADWWAVSMRGGVRPSLGLIESTAAFVSVEPSLAATVHAERPDLKVLFTSGFAGSSTADGDALPGRLLRKPYRMQDLAARIRESLDG